MLLSKPRLLVPPQLLRYAGEPLRSALRLSSNYPPQTRDFLGEQMHMRSPEDRYQPEPN